MDVIVIGCGASGIAAMRKLYDAGLNVLGLEAADRIGGRINTVEFGSSMVDLGANWCHSEKDNIVLQLAEPLGLLGKSESQVNSYVFSNGALAPIDLSDQIMGEIETEVNQADKENTKSVSECIQSALQTNKTLKSEPELSKYIAENYSRTLHLGGQADPKHGKSLKGLNENIPGDKGYIFHWKGKGFKTILDVLLNKYPDPKNEIPVQILFKKEVETIKWGLTDTNSKLVQVKCKDGSLYEAKSVIVTVSVAVLKERHSKLFDPALPPEKVNCINNLHVCVLDKIYIEFTKPWWPTTHAKFTILWRDEDLADYTGEDEWITHIFSLDTVDYQPNVLLAWIYGTGAEMMEKVSSDSVVAGVNKLLDRVLKKNFDVTPIKSVVRSQWASNDLARCAYAYRSVATEENGASAALLSEPLYQGDKFPVVCFAGEATSHHRHTAVHGAVEAGFREADRLIENFNEIQK